MLAVAEINPIQLAALSSADILAYGLVLLAVLVLGAGLLWIRRKFHPENQHQVDASLGIEQVEKLWRDGLISREEFCRLRLKALGLDNAPCKNDNSPLSTDVNRDDDGDVTDEDSNPPAGRSDNDE